MSNTIQNTSGVLPGFETTPATKAAEVESSGLFTEYLEAEMAEPVPAQEEAAQQEDAAQNPPQEEAAAQTEAAPAPAAPAVPDNPLYYNFLGGPVRVEGTTEFYDYDVTAFIEDSSASDSGFMTVCSGGVCRQIPIGGSYSTTPGSIFAPVSGFMPAVAASPAPVSAASLEPVASATPSTAPIVTAAAEKAALEASLMTEAVNAIVDEIIGGDDEERKDLLV